MSKLTEAKVLKELTDEEQAFIRMSEDVLDHIASRHIGQGQQSELLAHAILYAIDQLREGLLRIQEELGEMNKHLSHLRSVKRG